ncbi:hypothetical protein LCGC14_2779110, partial [marine sediment metagenome]
YVSIFPELHNKYQNYHNLIVDLTNDDIILTNWTVVLDPQNNLIANLESQYFIYDVDPYEAVSKGKVKQIYATINETNELVYYLTEDLNDPVNGWDNYDTLIMKIGFLNPDVLRYLNVSFYYDSGEQYIGSTLVTLDMIDYESGAVYIKLPDSNNYGQFKVQNNASVVFTPIFYNHTDFQGFFYTNGYPTIQMVEWKDKDVEDGYLNIDLDSRIISESQTVYIFNEMMEFLYEITDVDIRTESFNYGDTIIESAFYNFDALFQPQDHPAREMQDTFYLNQPKKAKLPEDDRVQVFKDTHENVLNMNNSDLLFLKYNATLDKSIGITIEDMVLQKGSYIPNYLTDQPDVPFAEISLLGVNNDGNSYTSYHLYPNRNRALNLL